MRTMHLPRTTSSLGTLIVDTSVHKHASYECGSRTHCRHIRATLRNIGRRVCGSVLPAELASCLHPRVPCKKDKPSPLESGRRSKLIVRDTAKARRLIRPTVDLPGGANSTGAARQFRHETMNFSQSWKRTSSDS